ncbi:MAG TPA: hypothetical protein VHD33_07245 [Legionellaceae bacterium]|nr:hypothetical protein [Legionellaceae bacterium]
MLKRILCTCLILASSIIFAHNNPVIVKIANATGIDCVLEKQMALYGDVSDATPIPKAIFRDQTISFTMQSHESRRKAIVLNYTCGNRSALFLTDITPFQGMLVSSGYELKSNNIHLDFSEVHNETGRILDKSPVEVYWRLTR